MSTIQSFIILAIIGIEKHTLEYYSKLNYDKVSGV